MTQDIIEGNKLIAEFMGAKIEVKDKVNYPNDNHEWEIHLEPFLIHERRYGKIEDLINKHCKYHTSWDWLMEVVVKIESLGNKRFGFVIDPIEIHVLDYESENEKPVAFATREQYSLKEAVYEAVIQFIQWYNQNHQ